LGCAANPDLIGNIAAIVAFAPLAHLFAGLLKPEWFA
jgi:hypothetical protein